MEQLHERYPQPFCQVMHRFREAEPDWPAGQHLHCRQQGQQDPSEEKVKFSLRESEIAVAVKYCFAM